MCGRGGAGHASACEKGPRGRRVLDEVWRVTYAVQRFPRTVPRLTLALKPRSPIRSAKGTKKDPRARSRSRRLDARRSTEHMPHRSWTTVLAPFVQVPHQTQNRPQFPSTATSCRLSALDSSDNGWQCACNAVEQTMRHVPTYAKAQRAGGGVNICCGIQSCRACARDGLPTLSTGSRLQPIRCTRLE